MGKNKSIGKGKNTPKAEDLPEEGTVTVDATCGASCESTPTTKRVKDMSKEEKLAVKTLKEGVLGSGKRGAEKVQLERAEKDEDSDEEVRMRYARGVAYSDDVLDYDSDGNVLDLEAEGDHEAEVRKARKKLPAPCDETLKRLGLDTTLPDSYVMRWVKGEFGADAENAWRAYAKQLEGERNAKLMASLHALRAARQEAELRAAKKQ